SVRVILASPPNSSTAFTTRSSSVATITRSAFSASFALSYTRWIMGFPASEIRGLPASRVEPYRAGMTMTTFGGLMEAPQAGNFSVRSGVLLQGTPRCYHTPLGRPAHANFLYE